MQTEGRLLPASGGVIPAAGHTSLDLAYPAPHKKRFGTPYNQGFGALGAAHPTTGSDTRTMPIYTNTPAPIAATKTTICRNWPTRRLLPARSAAAPSITRKFPLRASRLRALVGTSPISVTATPGKSRVTRRRPTVRLCRRQAVKRKQLTARQPRPAKRTARLRPPPARQPPLHRLRPLLPPPVRTNKPTARPS